MITVHEEGQYALIYAIFNGIDLAERAFAEFERNLPENLRVIKRFDYEEALELRKAGMKNEEIAKIYGVTKATFLSYICRAKKKRN